MYMTESGPRNPNMDPHLGRDDMVQQSNDNQVNQWEEAFKDAPSYYEHMEQMQEEEMEMEQ